ncbi:MAG: DeoR/GlpR transcriptional regulator, partial [Firmicutes bacterium]|nr:DeoR/GlpR transcriptional regulator [Bacillota bacterium]
MDIRRHKIVELINLHGEMSFSALKEHFPEVSEVTLRKDLRHLDSEQLIVRIHGGAKSLPTAIGAV